MKKNSKILYFTPHSPGTSDASGVRSKYIIESLSLQYNVEVLSKHNMFMKSPSNKSGLLVRLLKEFLVAVELSFNITIKKSDLIILSSPPFFAVLISSLFCVLLRKRYVLDIRDIYPEVFKHLGIISENSIIYRVLKYLTRIVYLRADSVITVTDGLKRLISSYSKTIKCHIVYNGYDKNLFKAEDKYEQFTVVFHGNLSRMQNVDLLLDVRKKLSKDIKMIVIGDGPQEDKLRNVDNLSFLGRLDYDEIPKHINKCHVGLSFRNDGEINEIAFPVKVFEYIGSRVPVVLTPLSNAGEFLEAHNLGFQFSNKEVEEIVLKIMELKKSGHKVQNSKVHEDLSRQKQSEVFFKVIEGL